MLRISNLVKSYADGSDQIRVLDGLSLAIERGESLAVMGPSGSGKSTLLNLIAGLLVADSGEIEIAIDREAFLMHALSRRARTRFRRRHLGYVHQFFNLIPTLTVVENVRLPRELNRLSLADESLTLLQEFGLAERINAFPETLSGGEQQRVAVARALVTRPAIVLADEPTGNLDRENASSVSQLLFDAARRRGAALIVATHSDDVAARADRVLNLEKT